MCWLAGFYNMLVFRSFFKAIVISAANAVNLGARKYLGRCLHFGTSLSSWGHPGSLGTPGKQGSLGTPWGPWEQQKGRVEFRCWIFFDLETISGLPFRNFSNTLEKHCFLFCFKASCLENKHLVLVGKTNFSQVSGFCCFSKQFLIVFGSRGSYFHDFRSLAKTLEVQWLFRVTLGSFQITEPESW